MQIENEQEASEGSEALEDDDGKAESKPDKNGY